MHLALQVHVNTIYNLDTILVLIELLRLIMTLKMQTHIVLLGLVLWFIFAYSVSIAVVDDTLKKCYDKDGNEITIDNTKVAAARTALDTEYAKIKYKDDRVAEYPDWQTQLDYIYHNGLDKWKTDIVDPVKTKYPKPS